MSGLPASLAIPPVAEEIEFKRGVIDIFVRMADMLGVPKSIGEIYGMLFASARPLAFQDIIEGLEISKGSASQGLRWLRGAGAIKLVYVTGDRRDHFEPETEMRKLLAGFLREKVRPHLDAGQLRVKALQAATRGPDFCPGDLREARVLRERVDKLRTWHKRANALAPLLDRFFG
jgi:HTH-type transcriptional regulator, glycine betaine synthesis regulator